MSVPLWTRQKTPASASASHSAFGERCPLSTQLEISHTRVVREKSAYDRSMNGFGAIEGLARMGFLVKGVLYMVIGALALQVAANAGGRATGPRGALTTALAQPFGHTLLLVAAIGLLGYAAWRVLQGLFDPDRPVQAWRPRAAR